jgi:PhnB protein
MTKSIPAGYPSVRPYLHVDGAAEAIAFYKKAFGAKERLRLEVPGDKIAHAEIEIADSLVMLCDPLPQFVSKPPPVLGGTSSEV